MSFLDHLEELRWHIIRSVCAILIIGVVLFLVPNFVFDTVIFGPKNPDFLSYRVINWLLDLIGFGGDYIPVDFNLQITELGEEFLIHIKVSFILGFIVAFPYVFWEIWRFVKPGLYENEQKVTRGATFFVTLLFLTGVFFGYYVLSPLAINFLTSYQVDPTILNEIDLTSYVSTIAMMVLACGLMFQLPMVVYFLSKIGVVTPDLMKEYRKHAFIVILIVGAIITPPDPITQIFVATPIFFLYQGSILVSARVHRRAEKEERETLERLERSEANDN